MSFMGSKEFPKALWKKGHWQDLPDQILYDQSNNVTLLTYIVVHTNVHLIPFVLFLARNHNGIKGGVLF